MSKRLLVFATKIPHPGKHYMHKEFQFVLVIMSVQMEFRKESVNRNEDIEKTHGRGHFCCIFSKQLVVIIRNYFEEWSILLTLLITAKHLRSKR